MSPRRIQRRRTKGWRMPAGAVYVGRGTGWGNMYRVVKVASDRYEVRHSVYGWHDSGLTRAEAHHMAVELFRRDTFDHARYGAENVRLCRKEMRGKDLACWCAPELPCHADVLLEIANGGQEKGGA